LSVALVDSTGEDYIILAFEVSNSLNKPLYLKASDFDIVDENDELIDTMKLVNAYPQIIEPGNVAVYYDVKTSDKISDTNIKLKAIPHIESEKSHAKQYKLFITGVRTGGSSYAMVTVKNSSSRTEYSNVHIAVIAKKSNNEVVSVMTTTIDSIKPGAEMEYKVKDRLQQRELGSNIVTDFYNFVYIDP